MSGRLKGIAEVRSVHRDAQGNVISDEAEMNEVTYLMGPNGPYDVQRNTS